MPARKPRRRWCRRDSRRPHRRLTRRCLHLLACCNLAAIGKTAPGLARRFLRPARRRRKNLGPPQAKKNPSSTCLFVHVLVVCIRYTSYAWYDFLYFEWGVKIASIFKSTFIYRSFVSRVRLRVQASFLFVSLSPPRCGCLRGCLFILVQVSTVCFSENSISFILDLSYPR